MNDTEKNLIPLDKRTKEEQRAIATMGGKASGEARRKKRDLRVALEMLLEKEYKDAKGGSKSGAELIAFKQFEKALTGDTRAFEVIRDTSGQKPIDRVEQVVISDEAREEVRNFLDSYEDDE